MIYNKKKWLDAKWTKECKHCGGVMKDLAQSKGYVNFICLERIPISEGAIAKRICNTHYAGDKGKEKWYTGDEWEVYVNDVN